MSHEENLINSAAATDSLDHGFDIEGLVAGALVSDTTAIGRLCATNATNRVATLHAVVTELASTETDTCGIASRERDSEALFGFAGCVVGGEGELDRIIRLELACTPWTAPGEIGPRVRETIIVWPLRHTVGPNAAWDCEMRVSVIAATASVAELRTALSDDLTVKVRVTAS